MCQMEHAGHEILDGGPRELAAGSLTIRSMQRTSPIRRYILLRQRAYDASESRWSLERIAPAPRGPERALIAAQRAKRAVEPG
jgi:hypothetical protein